VHLYATGRNKRRVGGHRGGDVVVYVFEREPALAFSKTTIVTENQKPKKFISV
jgi:hypothetical protein